MDLPFETVVLVTLVGAAAGWFVSHLSEAPGFGLGGDLIAGLIGAFAGAVAAPKLGIEAGASSLALIVTTLVGAVVVTAGVRYLAGVWDSQRSPRADAYGRPLPPEERAEAAPRRAGQSRISEEERARLWMRKS